MSGSVPRLCALALLAVLALSVAPIAAAAGAGEYQVKAAFIYNLTRFVRWPADAFASADARFGVCVVGDDPFGESLRLTLEDQHVDGHPIVLRTLGQRPPPADCRLVFIPRGQASHGNRRGQDPAMLSRLLAAPNRLLVSDIRGFAGAGGGVELVDRGSRIGLVINLPRLERVGLRAMASLLRLAEIVED